MYVRRSENTRYDSRDQIPTVKHRIIHNVAFSYRSVDPLVKIKGTMDRVMYKNILAAHMLLHGRQIYHKDEFFNCKKNTLDSKFLPDEKKTCS